MQLNSYKISLLWRFLFVSCLPMLLVGLLSLSFLITSTREQLDEQLTQQAQGIRKEIQFIVDKPEQTLKHVAGGLAAYDFQRDGGLDNRLQSLLSRSELIEAIFILDESDTIIHAGLPHALENRRSEFIGYNLSKNSAVQRGKKQRLPYWSSIVPSIVTGESSLSLCVPFHQYMLFASVNLSRFSSLTTRIPVDKKIEIYVVGEDGRVLFQSDAIQQRAAVDLSSLPPIAQGMKGHEGRYSYIWQAVDYVGTVLIIPETGWLVLVSQPSQQAYGEIGYLRQLFLLGGGGCIVLSLLFSFAMARRLARPMIQLEACVQKIARGDEQVSIDIDGFAEANALAEDVRAMGDAIREREAQLSRERDRFEALFNNVNDAVFMACLDENMRIGRFVEVNGVACDTLGYSRDELLMLSPEQIDTNLNSSYLNDHPGYQGLASALENSALIETTLMTKFGREIPFELNLQKLNLDQQEMIVCVARNISDRKQTQRALNALVTSTVGATGKACFDKILREICQYFEVDGGLVGILNAGGHIECQSMLFLGEYRQNYSYPLAGSPCEKVFKNEVCFYPGNVRELFPHHVDFKQLAIESYFGIPLLNAEQKVVGVLNGFSRQRMHLPSDAREVLSIVAARAATELERLKADEALAEHRKQLSHLAFHDPLTQLPNRLRFAEVLEGALPAATGHGHYLSLLFIDLDRFKNINDSLGHSIGDKLLQAVARRMGALIGDHNQLARLGGDEFAIVLFDGVTPVAGADTALRVIDALSQPFQIDDYSLHVSASIGLTVAPVDAQDPDELIKCADIAMFKAKDAGRNTFKFYERSMNLKTHELLLLENDLRHALEKEQLELYYQPQMDLQRQCIVGFEALLRWNHPERGIVSPLEFIPLAEETGLIVPIGEWILRTACQQICAWNQCYQRQLRVAVNISARQFHHYDLVYCIEQMLEQTGVRTEWLELEITESLLMYDIQSSIDTMMRLKKLGVRLAIDDFGTGYSSLSYLKKFPISSLKIDKSFVDDLLTDASDAAIAESTLALASKMDLMVVAEGIERQEQFDYLQGRGCQFGQGYLISRPLKVEQCEAFCRETFGDLPSDDDRVEAVRSEG
ncbi:MAG: hypothetical protein C0620_05620 [Desulfuromonas sp.]|nr:MAG: hypothetical protein C0620_05620 [Desulfuromonas sp.]